MKKITIFIFIFLFIMILIDIFTGPKFNRIFLSLKKNSNSSLAITIIDTNIIKSVLYTPDFCIQKLTNDNKWEYIDNQPNIIEIAYKMGISGKLSFNITLDNGLTEGKYRVEKKISYKDKYKYIYCNFEI